MAALRRRSVIYKNNWSRRRNRAKSRGRNEKGQGRPRPPRSLDESISEVLGLGFRTAHGILHWFKEGIRVGWKVIPLLIAWHLVTEEPSFIQLLLDSTHRVLFAEIAFGLCVIMGHGKNR